MVDHSIVGDSLPINKVSLFNLTQANLTLHQVAFLVILTNGHKAVRIL